MNKIRLQLNKRMAIGDLLDQVQELEDIIIDNNDLCIIKE